jgi:hypothetical protein
VSPVHELISHVCNSTGWNPRQGRGAIRSTLGLLDFRCDSISSRRTGAKIGAICAHALDPDTRMWINQLHGEVSRWRWAGVAGRAT